MLLGITSSHRWNLVVESPVFCNLLYTSLLSLENRLFTQVSTSLCAWGTFLVGTKRDLGSELVTCGQAVLLPIGIQRATFLASLEMCLRVLMVPDAAASSWNLFNRYLKRGCSGIPSPRVLPPEGLLWGLAAYAFGAATNSISFMSKAWGRMLSWELLMVWQQIQIKLNSFLSTV